MLNSFFKNVFLFIHLFLVLLVNFNLKLYCRIALLTFNLKFVCYLKIVVVSKMLVYKFTDFSLEMKSNRKNEVEDIDQRIDFLERKLFEEQLFVKNLIEKFSKLDVTNRKVQKLQCRTSEDKIIHKFGEM